MANEKSIGQTIDHWAEITIKQWLWKMDLLGVGTSKQSTGQLARSFYHHVNTAANGNPEYVEFAFEYYGKFVDMGVGKGVTLKNRDKLQNAGKTNRIAKPWFSSVFYDRLAILKKELAKYHAEYALKVIKTNLEKYNIDGNKISSSRSSGSSKISSPGEGYSVADYKKVRFK